MLKCTIALCCLIGVIGIETSAFAQATITLIPDLSGGTHNSVATGVSNNGAVSGYTFFSNDKPQAFRWTAAGGTTPMGSGMAESAAFGISRDGLTIVGYDIDSTSQERAVKWNSLGVRTPLSGPTAVGSTDAQASSGDGSIIVGEVSKVATQWVNGAATAIGPGQAMGTSGDGSVVVGRLIDSASEAFRWTAATGATRLGYFTGGTTSVAMATSDDGSVVVGGSNSTTTGPYYEAFRWTSAGMVSIGHLGAGSTLANDTTADGSIIVGNGEQAFIWDAGHGMRPLADALLQDYGLDLQGFKLQSAQAISANGQYIVGYTGGFGDRTAWIITLPEPGTAVLMLGATLMMLRRTSKRC